MTLAEDISAHADIPASGWPENVYTVSELAERFDVSTKTIFRWHRRGLTGWRLRFADRRVRLAFADRCVRRFVASNTELVHRGSSFSQLTETERERIIERARQLADEGERTVNAIAKLIAGEMERAVETIRLILKSHDAAHPKTGIFNRSNLKVEPDDERLAIWEAYVDGASISVLAQRFNRTVHELYRIITEMRARELKARAIEFVSSEEFDAADADERILERPPRRGADQRPHAGAAHPGRTAAVSPAAFPDRAADARRGGGPVPQVQLHQVQGRPAACGGRPGERHCGGARPDRRPVAAGGEGQIADHAGQPAPGGEHRQAALQPDAPISSRSSATATSR